MNAPGQLKTSKPDCIDGGGGQSKRNNRCFVNGVNVKVLKLHIPSDEFQSVTIKPVKLVCPYKIVKCSTHKKIVIVSL